jgi:hypothetical protein
MYKSLICFAVSAVCLGSPAIADVINYNSAPSDKFIYGNGNDYVQANSAVLLAPNATAPTTELALRFHQTYVAAPPSDNNGVYSFALGTSAMQLSFDWGIDGFSDNASITLVNLLTGQHVTYNPFAAGNDNTGSTTDGDLAQNSARLNWFGIGFDGSINDTYSATLTAGGHSLTTYAQIGSGAPDVPEPATWAMMLLGFGGIGAALRRSRKPVLAQLA